MPLVGVVDPSHKEMARDTLGRLPEWLPLDVAVAQARETGTKWSPWTYELMSAMFALYQERQSRISATSLVDHCTRADIIKRKADYVDDLENIYVPFRGTMLHKVLEDYGSDDALVEVRFFTDVGGVEISCSPDHLTRDTLTDYKVTENPPRYNNPYTNHSEQVQFNAFICRNATAWRRSGEALEGTPDFSRLAFDPREHPVKKLVLLYLSPKYPKALLVEKTVDYFDIVKNKEVRGKRPYVMTDDRVLDILEPRVAMFKAGLEAYPDWPDGAEKLWGGEPGWACPGYPLCRFPNCLAKRYPRRLTW
jgi:hypothetical protein